MQTEQDGTGKHPECECNPEPLIDRRRCVARTFSARHMAKVNPRIYISTEEIDRAAKQNNFDAARTSVMYRGKPFFMCYTK